MPNLVTQGEAIFGEAVLSDGGSNAGAPVARTAVITMTAATGAGGAFNWVNPTGKRILITSVAIDVTVAATSGSIDVGVEAISTSDDTLIDGGAVNAIAVINSGDNSGTNGALMRAAAAGQYVTGSITGTIGSFAGTAYITYVPFVS